MATCPKCGFQCDPDDSFCRSCGDRLPDDESSRETRTPWPVVLPVGQMRAPGQDEVESTASSVGLGDGPGEDVIDISLSDLDTPTGPVGTPDNLVVSLGAEDMQSTTATTGSASVTPPPQAPLVDGGRGASSGSVPRVRPSWLWPAIAAGALVIAVGIGVGVYSGKDGSAGDVSIAPTDSSISAQPSGEYYDYLAVHLITTANLYARQAWGDFQLDLSKVDAAYLESLEPHTNELVCDFIDGRSLDETINPREGDADAMDKEVHFLVLGESRYAVGTYSMSGNSFGAVIDLMGDSTYYTNGLEDRNGWLY